MTPDLRAECLALTRYLISRNADDYVVQQYVRGVGLLDISSSPFDVLLCRWATGPRFLARGVDFYGRIFRPNGGLRKKLVLLVAILESYGPTASVTDRPSAKPGLLRFSLKMAVEGALSMLALLLGVPLLLPLQVLLGRSGN